MSMVYFSLQAEQDLSDVVTGLLLWTKVSISEDEALSYVDDIYDVAFTIPDVTYHQKCQYLMHRLHGEYHLKYKRNNRTTWYIIYDIDAFNNIYVNKIISNHLTIS